MVGKTSGKIIMNEAIQITGKHVSLVPNVPVINPGNLTIVTSK